MNTISTPETLADIEEALRLFAKMHENGELSPLPHDFSDLADRLHAAAERERESWRRKLADMTEVADQFKATLTRILDWLSFKDSRPTQNQ